jgi:hypothetical protein
MNEEKEWVVNMINLSTYILLQVRPMGLDPTPPSAYQAPETQSPSSAKE